MRTPLATETIEIAFMLLAFHRAGATLTPPLECWARKTLAQNGELRPDQIEGLGNCAECLGDGCAYCNGSGVMLP